MNKNEQITTISNVTALLEIVKKSADRTTAEELEKIINQLDTICDHIKRI